MNRLNPMKHFRLALSLTVLSALAVFGPTSDAWGQEKSVNPGINEPFEDPDVDAFVGRFERDGRDAFDHRHEVVKALDLKPGMAVADIGAGTGLFSRLFSPEVGRQGKVYAVDIAEEFVRHVERVAQAEKLQNIVGVVCRPDSVNLPPGSVDLAFICDTYHHFEFPHKTMRSLHRALRPKGQLVLIDFHRVEGESDEWVLGHVRAGQEVFTREIEAAGFRKVDEKKGLLDESYFVRFEKVPDAAKGDEAGRPTPAERPAERRQGTAVADVSPDAFSRAVRGDEGFLVHPVESPYQAGPTEIRVLPPDRLVQGEFYPVVYVLPVEARGDEKYGDGLLQVKKHGLHNEHRAIFVAPTFSRLPWYADHPTDPVVRQESHFLKVVVPLVESAYPAVKKPEGRLLLGFSKSGWGAWSLLLRHPDTFGRAAAWDAPLTMDRLGQYGTADIFATPENFERYRIADLLRAKAEKLHGEKRLILTGYGNFREHHRKAHDLLEGLKVPHVYKDGPHRKHDWHSGWVPEAVGLLFDGSRGQ